MQGDVDDDRTRAPGEVRRDVQRAPHLAHSRRFLGKARSRRKRNARAHGHVATEAMREESI